MIIKRGGFRVISLVFIMSFFVIGILASSVSAVGLVYGQQYLSADEGGSVCITYKVFNSLSEDASVEVSVAGELEEVISSIEPETQLVPGNTLPGSAIPIEVCFRVPDNIYAGDRDCTGPLKDYSGHALFSQVPLSTGGSGSATSVAVSAPLILRVECVPDTTNYNFIYPIISVILAVLIIIALVVRFRSKAVPTADKAMPGKATGKA